MQIDGVGRSLLLTVMSETGLNLSEKFPTFKHYISWLALCPNKKTSGGKIISSKTKKVKNKSAAAYRQAALNVAKKKNCPLSDFYHRIAHRAGKKAAITATARKIATIVYKMLETKEAYQAQNIQDYQELVRKRKIKSIRRAMAHLDINIEDLKEK